MRTVHGFALVGEDNGKGKAPEPSLFLELLTNSQSDNLRFPVGTMPRLFGRRRQNPNGFDRLRRMAHNAVRFARDDIFSNAPIV
jgi:hypothetical protein